MAEEKQKKIAVINDFCGFGRCSLTVALPIISALKVQCCPLPTAIFSNHTGYSDFYVTDYTKHMESYMAQWEAMDLQFDGILSGFLGSPQQIGIVKRFLERFKAENTVTVIDPVMGDNGTLYASYSQELANAMRELVPYADILTPNLTEACFLTGTPYQENMNAAELTQLACALSNMGPKQVVISGLERDGDLENFVYESGKSPIVIREHKVGPTRAGTGDVFSSMIAADAVNGVHITDAVRHASEFIAKALRLTLERNIPKTDGICFEEFLCEI